MTLRSYHGRCHCGAVRFELTTEPITAGIRCNCSICIRRGAVMSVPYFPPEAFTRLDGLEAVTRYRWGDHDVNHYFCATCGIYPLHDLVTKPGHYRVNLGCLDEIDPLTLEIGLIDGRAL